MDTLQNALKELYISLGGDASAVRAENDINDLIRMVAALGIGADLAAAGVKELPPLPKDDGTYSLQLVLSDEEATLSWEAVE